MTGGRAILYRLEPGRTAIVRKTGFCQREAVIMPTRDFRPGHHEEWSERNQTLRHSGEKLADDDLALLHNPTDYSAVGGPEDERVYGHSRSDNGYYPWNPF